MTGAGNRHRFTLPVVAALITMAIIAACIFYRNTSDIFLSELSAQLSEVAMKQGIRREAAGNSAGALDYYQRALAGNFHGPQNRIHVEKRCGVILWKLEQYEAAIPHLMRAQDSPLRSLNGYKPLVESLLAVGRTCEAKSVAQIWFAATVEDSSSRADAHQALGRLALLDHDVLKAKKHFEAAIALLPDHEALVDRAQLRHDEESGVASAENLVPKEEVPAL